MARATGQLQRVNLHSTNKETRWHAPVHGEGLEPLVTACELHKARPKKDKWRVPINNDYNTQKVGAIDDKLLQQ